MNSFCLALVFTMRFNGGRLVAHTTNGEDSHKTKRGTAAKKASGRKFKRKADTESVMNGAGHMILSEAERVSLPFPDSLDGSHSSRCRCVTRTRNTVDMMVTKLVKASYGRQTIVNNACTMRLSRERAEPAMCGITGISRGLRKKSSREIISGGTSTIPETARVHKNGFGRVIHPKMKRNTRDGDIRLRLRLSNIFHFDRMDSVFLHDRPSNAGTVGKNQRAICQSPRIHRRRRLTSA